MELANVVVEVIYIRTYKNTNTLLLIGGGASDIRTSLDDLYSRLVGSKLKTITIITATFIITIISRRRRWGWRLGRL